MNRHVVAGWLYLFAGAIFLFIGLRSEPRQTVYVILGPVFIILGLTRMRLGRPR